MTKDFVRRDKRVRCRSCYHEFWADAALPNRFIRCTRCSKLGIETVKEYGRRVIETHTYQLTGEDQEGENNE